MNEGTGGGGKAGIQWPRISSGIERSTQEAGRGTRQKIEKETTAPLTLERTNHKVGWDKKKDQKKKVFLVCFLLGFGIPRPSVQVSEMGADFVFFRVPLEEVMRVSALCTSNCGLVSTKFAVAP